MRPALVVAPLVGALGAAAPGCTPTIEKGTYFCGPERYCPPGLACDEPSFTCEAPSLARAFGCPADSELSEPDDTPAEARSLGALACGQPLINDLIGCLEGDDVDLYALDYQVACRDDPRIEVRLRFPIGLAPLRLSLVDEGGDEVAAGESCTPSGDRSGSDTLCLEARPPAGAYFLRVELSGEVDCDGDCRHNQYRLDASLPFS